jgi:Fic-DOC domain mobile mystery protein B
VSGIFVNPDDSATPLTPEEMRDLIPAHIADRRDLNFAEQANIARAQEWAMDGRKRDLLREKFIKDLHQRMLADLWRWAGRFRTSQRNIGIDYWLIPVELRKLLDDARTWIEFETYPTDEIAVRFHHRLVLIHPFPNGNGSHARLMADLLAMRLGQERFSWGRDSLRNAGNARERYIAALRTADRYDITALLAFARAKRHCLPHTQVFDRDQPPSPLERDGLVALYVT